MVKRRIVQAHCNKSVLVSGNDAICFQDHSGLNTEGYRAILWFHILWRPANKSIHPMVSKYNGQAPCASRLASNLVPIISEPVSMAIQKKVLSFPPVRKKLYLPIPLVRA